MSQSRNRHAPQCKAEMQCVHVRHDHRVRRRGTRRAAVAVAPSDDDDDDDDDDGEREMAHCVIRTIALIHPLGHSHSFLLGRRWS